MLARSSFVRSRVKVVELPGTHSNHLVEFPMRIVVFVALVVSATFASIGCTPVRYDRSIAHGDPTQDDAGNGMMPNDAAVVPGHDAGPSMPGNDAWVAPQPDAWMMPSCPTYTTDVQPLYQMHCANCHTTGSDPRFGSSYTVANQSSSSCGTSMADCTIQRGQQGGDMAFRDPLGGFSATEVQTIQSWIDCGRPR
jgi:hypothetical protein